MLPVDGNLLPVLRLGDVLGTTQADATGPLRAVVLEADGIRRVLIVDALRDVRALLVAASTGGPPALARLLGALPADLPLPVLLVQHMGASFMAGFANWLDSVVPQRVELARNGEVPGAGMVHVAPGDAHLTMARGGTLRLATDGPVGGQRPSATRLIESAAMALEGAALAVVLTGMGEDGAPGVRALLAAGGQAVAEDASTSIVYGMPAAAHRAGALSLPLDLIAPHIRRVVERPR